MVISVMRIGNGGVFVGYKAAKYVCTYRLCNMYRRDWWCNFDANGFVALRGGGVFVC
jgi:hypothetical protein